MRLLLIFFATLTVTHAQSIKSLINYSLQKHYSLQSISTLLSSYEQKIEKSQLWSNPNLSMGVNDIQFRKPFSRQEERMQNQSFTFQQKITWGRKLETQKKIQEEEREMVSHSLEASKVLLAYKIRSTAYTIKELQQRISIVKKYAQLEKQNIELYEDTIATDHMSHTNSVHAKLSLANIEIKIEKYKAMLKSQKEELNYLAQKRVKSISNRLKISKPKSLRYYLKRVKNNPSYHQKLSNTKRASALLERADLEQYPDPFVKVGYYHRLDFPDYTSISVGIALPVYGKERLNSQIAQKAILQAKSKSIDYQSYLKSQIRIYHIKVNEAYRIYNIINTKSLPQLQHLLELSSSAIEEGADLFTYTNILEEQLSLEEEKISMIGEYLRGQAKLKLLIGVR